MGESKARLNYPLQVSSKTLKIKYTRIDIVKNIAASEMRFVFVSLFEFLSLSTLLSFVMLEFFRAIFIILNSI